MGFGTLFFGYLLSLNITYHFWTDIFAFIIMLIGMNSLSTYARSFRFAKFSLIPLVVVAGAGFYFEVSRYAGGTFPEDAVTYISIAEYMLLLVFTVFMLDGIVSLASELKLHEIRLKALRNKFLGCIYYIGVIILSFDIGIGTTAAAILSVVFLLFGLIWMIMNLLLIYSCYRWICLAGDEDNPRRRSRFDFINKINDKMDKREAEALEKTLEEQNARRARMAEKKKGKKK